MLERVAYMQTLVRAAYTNQLRKNPKMTKSVTSAFCTALGNLIAQLLQNTKLSDLDLIGTAKYSSFGFISAQIIHAWYKLLEKYTSNLRYALLIQLFLDQAIFSPIYFVIYYTYMSLLNKNLRSLPSKLANELIPVSIASAKLWIPVQFITFKYIPQEFRILWGNLIAMIWNIYFCMREKQKAS